MLGIHARDDSKEDPTAIAPGEHHSAYDVIADHIRKIKERRGGKIALVDSAPLSPPHVRHKDTKTLDKVSTAFLLATQDCFMLHLGPLTGDMAKMLDIMLNSEHWKRLSPKYDLLAERLYNAATSDVPWPRFPERSA